MNMWNCLVCFSASHAIRRIDKLTVLPHGQEYEPANSRNCLWLQELFISVLVKIMHIYIVLTQNYSVMTTVIFLIDSIPLKKSVKKINVTSSSMKCDIIVGLNKH